MFRYLLANQSIFYMYIRNEGFFDFLTFLFTLIHLNLHSCNILTSKKNSINIVELKEDLSIKILYSVIIML